MTRRPQTRDQLLQQLQDNRGFLRLSADAFDRGMQGEAKRLAVVVRVLVHDTQQSHSLLGQLGVKDQLRYIDSSNPIQPHSPVSSSGLTSVRISFDEGRAYYFAPLDDGAPPRYANPPVDFAAWWTTPVTVDGAGALYSRRDFVLLLANQDGGAHVDPALDDKYAAIRHDNSMGWIYFEEGQEEELETPVFPSVRQIAWEIETTMAQQLPSLLS